MPKISTDLFDSARKSGSVKISLADAAAISRLEGLNMSQDMVRTFEGLEKSGKSQEERRAALKKKYGKVGGQQGPS